MHPEELASIMYDAWRRMNRLGLPWADISPHARKRWVGVANKVVQQLWKRGLTISPTQKPRSGLQRSRETVYGPTPRGKS